MFDFAGLFQRTPEDASVPSPAVLAEPGEDASARPLDHVVLKNGRPFAILNATPELARRTLDGFVHSTPEARWTLARC